MGDEGLKMGGRGRGKIVSRDSSEKNRHAWALGRFGVLSRKAPGPGLAVDVDLLSLHLDSCRLPPQQPPPTTSRPPLHFLQRCCPPAHFSRRHSRPGPRCDGRARAGVQELDRGASVLISTPDSHGPRLGSGDDIRARKYYFPNDSPFGANAKSRAHDAHFPLYV